MTCPELVGRGTCSDGRNGSWLKFAPKEGTLFFSENVSRLITRMAEEDTDWSYSETVPLPTLSKRIMIAQLMI